MILKILQFSFNLTQLHKYITLIYTLAEDKKFR